ncbi:Asp-tRNA(Asn)/Glu-tRNA(Gln) amidotransferase subunit GatC [Vagococcus fluvialis]|jgi:aspartyl-tRNA(Asn)/glutamyl-tRNA(Gln) amidotransferase subunit C|uniref:Asp-tRNA(Asn)/Glu-tRNA(Gln) amidotransferase subunit GatC n=1 Tax=Vagococcus fluvialis TaxID=2738 RepID=UPI001432FBFF|nr:Asp-tRNA(Asn)/Glu-tRNA(Gln) amidotransferase subunit GatC [Vagococcus fluvialis]MDR2278310.1 Asp-tRNA(Asn)/Glu-tRNA(Gln) amidotransferase subunit GatC [Vagococcus sp.]MBO0436696.1 Asp-tRNA(Asn)/Glu-tRNA(Gln) amidotransferase subunit GatC [Vagococcus fluvialis]MBO0444043.1 Asp-tRNA(Asn)/Glu-tRNA(Gln) amidotransferase subunit GatC [Vagococcus fluvialis]MBO0487946.1 Asp-tRNA(Asn)/Glu-tRNA(Gln) amidotransferase subunit GatC [Vagococcus fluvialis]MCM2137916.1 Asp-tRNA(Asn)/Glu-tRNA(Gln) amidotra
MAISKEEVKKVAALSKLSFKEEELELFTSQMGKIIDMVEELGEVDTEGVPFTSNVVSEINVLREDVVIKGESREELLKNVPETKDGFIKVPAIMDNGEAGA